VIRELINIEAITNLIYHADLIWKKFSNPLRPHSKVEVEGAVIERIDAIRSVACNIRLLGTMLALLGPNIYVEYSGFTINSPQKFGKFR